MLNPGASPYRATVSVPNPEPLEHPITPVNGLIYPAYQAQPAPIGVADYGLGVTPYSYNTSHILGQVTLNAPPNETQPGAARLINPTAVGESLGFLGSEYEFGIQLNTMGINLTIPGTNDQGIVWAQNVVNWNDSGLHFVQDTWNFSAYSDTLWNLNSIYAGCGGDQSHANYILEIYGFILQCSEGNIPLTAADYPVTLSLFNNFTTNANERSELVYGYNIYEAGAGTTLSGAFTVVFNNPDTSVAPPNSPANTINPFNVTPTIAPGEGWWQDAEMDIVGGIGGDNAIFSSINGTVSLEYSNASSGGWKTVPSAYNFGTDTAETSTGIAGYWTTSHVLVINQGPTMLYGLWNAEPQVSVASGDIHLSGTISPSYGFVFVSNTPPVLNPWGGTERDNMSWLPTNSSGGFNTYLPPLGAPWTTTYYVQAFAAGATEYNDTVTGTSTLSISLASSTLINAPLYMSTAAQASALAKALGASASAPYTFANLVVNVNFTFDHLNDFDYPSFEVFQAEGVNSVLVNDVVLGTDSVASGNSYILDRIFAPSTGLLNSAPTVYTDVGSWTQGIGVYFGSGDEVENQILYGDWGYSQITIWSDTDALVYSTLCIDEVPGVWIGDSLDTTVSDTFADDAYGVMELGSTGTMVTSLEVEYGLGVYAIASVDATYSWLNATLESTGIVAGVDYGLGPVFSYWGASGLTVNNLNVTYYSLGANITFSTGTTINNLTVYDPEYGYSQGLDVDGASSTTVNKLVANYASGMYVWNATDFTVNGLVLENETDYYWNTQVYESTNIVLNNPVIYDTYYYEYGYGLGVIGWYDTGITVTDPFVYEMFGGIIFLYSSGYTGTDLASEYSTFSYELDYSDAISVNGVNAYDDYIGFNLFESHPATVENVVANDETGYDDYYGGGVALFNDTGNTVTTVTSEYGSTGVKIDTGGSGNTVSKVFSTSYDSEVASVGVWIEDSNGNTVTTVTAVDGGIGVELTDDAQGNTITSVSAEFEAIGVFEDEALANTISTVTAIDDSTGVEIFGSTGGTISGVTVSFYSVGVLADPSSGLSISDVTVTDEARGVILEGTTQFTVSTVSVTGYSIGVLLDGANDGQVSGVTLNDTSIGVAAYSTEFVTISGVTATGTSPAVSPWDYSDVWDAPIAAVDTFGTTGVTVTDVTATNYPAALYDDASQSLTVTALNATGGFYAIALNETFSGLFTGIGAFHDYQGMLLEGDANDNTITGSSFVDDTSYGVAVAYGYDNTIWNNNFIGDNGATSTYNSAHIQALGNDYTEFYVCTNYDCTTGVGNYWADWHTYGSNGYLAPYWTSGTGVDLFPIGPQETFTVSFTETGLASGTSWSVTLNGVTATSTTTFLNFTEPMGTYSYQVGGVAGYTVSPASGSVVLGASAYSVQVSYSATLYAVTLSAGGLATGTAWSATVNGVTQSTTGTSITFYLPAGTGYTYSFNAVSGYNLPATGASGTFGVTTEPVSLATTYSPTSTPSYVQTSDFNNWLGVAIALAVIALVIGLLALFLRRRKEPPTQGAQAWTPPPAQSGGSAPPASGDSSSWSEGPPSGGSPPS